MTARIDSQIIITNITDTHIEGKITSKNSNYTLTMYNDESIVKAQFGYDSGLKGDWYIAARPSNGIFSIEIPAGSLRSPSLQFKNMSSFYNLKMPKSFKY